MAIISDVQDLMERLCAIEHAAISSADCIPYYLHKQERFPYITHRLGETTYDANSEDIDIPRRDVVARLVIGHVDGQGYAGENEQLLFDWIEALETAYQSDDGARLVGATYPEEPTYTYVEPMTLTRNSGLRAFSGFPVGQVGVEFFLSVPFMTSEE